jgi:hypothetical protein
MLQQPMMEKLHALKVQGLLEALERQEQDETARELSFLDRGTAGRKIIRRRRRRHDPGRGVTRLPNRCKKNRPMAVTIYMHTASFCAKWSPAEPPHSKDSSVQRSRSENSVYGSSPRRPWNALGGAVSRASP